MQVITTKPRNVYEFISCYLQESLAEFNAVTDLSLAPDFCKFISQIDQYTEAIPFLARAGIPTVSASMFNEVREIWKHGIGKNSQYMKRQDPI